MSKLKQFLSHYLQLQPAGKAVQFATAALMVELMAVDDQVDASERQRVTELVSRHFDLMPEQGEALVQLAEHEQQHLDFRYLARLLNEAFSHDEKISILDYLWQVAYADNKIELNEEELLQEVASIFAISNQEYQLCKKHAENESRGRLKP